MFFAENNLFCIACHCNIRIMSYNNHLTFLFSFTYTWNKFTINRLISQPFLKILFCMVSGAFAYPISKILYLSIFA